ncbi:MAG TPA: hypothetical protein VGD69_26445 [Herpetosiphonaceae bacterium]
MKRWRAPRDPLSPLCFLGALASLVLVFFAFTQLVAVFQGPLEEWPISFGTFGWALAALAGLVVAIALVWLGIQRSSLSYELDRNGIYISQLGSRYTIPLDQVVAFSAADQPRQTSKPVIVFGRAQPSQQIMIETYHYAYRLAVAERDLFSRELQERRQLGTIQSPPEGLTRTRQTLFDFFAGATTRRLLIIGLLLNLVLWAVLTWRFPTLPATVPVRFDPLGGTAGTRAKTYTLLLPAIATGAWFGNLLLALVSYPRSRLVAELLLLGALIVQLVLLLAAWFIVTLAQ